MKPRLLITAVVVLAIFVGTVGSASAAFSPIETRPGKYQACPEKVWTEVCEVPGAIPVQVPSVEQGSSPPTTTTLNVKWGSPAHEEVVSGYWVEVGTGNTPTNSTVVFLEGKAPDVREATISGLQPGTEYWVSVEPVVPEPEYEPVSAAVTLKTLAASTGSLRAKRLKHR
jgi:hypothetical protein